MANLETLFFGLLLVYFLNWLKMTEPERLCSVHAYLTQSYDKHKSSMVSFKKQSQV